MKRAALLLLLISQSAHAQADSAGVSFLQILIAAAVIWYVYRRFRRKGGRRPKGDTPSLERWSERLTPVWSGAEREVAFTYLSHGSQRRRRVRVNAILRDGHRYYLRGTCLDANAERTFCLDGITTKILDHGRRYDADDWIEHVTGRPLP